MKHWMIAAATGYEESLNAGRRAFSHRPGTKFQFEEAYVRTIIMLKRAIKEIMQTGYARGAFLKVAEVDYE
ncbi:LOW QUALITY PROTEIN: hypothetical protein ACHAXR_012915 [Thalassiosira sp. AJA248-18]